MDFKILCIKITLPFKSFFPETFWSTLVKVVSVYCSDLLDSIWKQDKLQVFAWQKWWKCYYHLLSHNTHLILEKKTWFWSSFIWASLLQRLQGVSTRLGVGSRKAVSQERFAHNIFYFFLFCFDLILCVCVFCNSGNLNFQPWQDIS